MQLGVVGLGRMGGNIVRRLQRDGHQCVAYDRAQAAVQSVTDAGAKGAASLEDLVKALTDKPRAVWVMLPAGKITQETVDRLAELLESGDIIIDGGNSFYKDDIRNAKELRAKGNPLRRCRNVGRRVGSRPRLLHDGRRRQGGGRRARSHPGHAGARHRHDPAHPGPGRR